jgi:hypothetical protein
MNRSLQYACNYALLRFLPYPETGEFVNLGVAVHCPAHGLFAARLEDGDTTRVTNFFPELDQGNFRAAGRAMAVEIERVGELIANAKDLELAGRLFLELVRPRESVFRFGEVRTILTEEPATVAARLFERYIERHSRKAQIHRQTVLA